MSFTLFTKKKPIRGIEWAFKYDRGQLPAQFCFQVFVNCF
jgi:hypothetical protein